VAQGGVAFSYGRGNHVPLAVDWSGLKGMAEAQREVGIWALRAHQETRLKRQMICFSESSENRELRVARGSVAFIGGTWGEKGCGLRVSGRAAWY
jgi:hypothetical protein